MSMGESREIYRNIAEKIRSHIEQRRLKPHTRLASEQELARAFRAARATVRRALAQLQAEGLIYARRGEGSFVAEPRVEQDLDQLFSFTEVMVYHHLRPASRVLEAGRRTIDDGASPVLAALALRPGSAVFYIKRLRLGGGEPLVIAQTWLPERCFPRFLGHNLERQSIYDIMGEYGYRPTDAIQTFEAVALDGQQARLLEVEPGSPGMLICRTGYAKGLAVEYAVDHYRGDRTRFRARLGLLEHGIGPAHHG